jgi:nucleotide-binding universal stress UspA family protein
MVTRILVPLDGSRSAESVLPATASFARVCRAPVALVHIVEKNAPQAVHDEHHLQDWPEAEAYLDGLKVLLESEGVAVTCHVHQDELSNVPAAIALHVQELGADFVMMCTHGRNDIRRFIWGSIAQQVAATHTVPVFFIPPKNGRGGRAYTCGSIMLPLDGREEHEPAVAVAQFLAGAFKAAVFPVLAVPRSSEVGASLGAISRLLPRATEELLDQSTVQGKEYLDGIRERLEADGLTVSTLLVRGNPERALLRTIAKHRPDLMVLGTHGRSGLSAAFEGSVAPKICSRSRVPIILVPAKEEE